MARPEVARVTLSVALPRATGVVLAVLALDLARRYLHMGTVDAAGGAAVLTMAARWAGAAAVPAFVLLHGLEAVDAVARSSPPSSLAGSSRGA